MKKIEIWDFQMLANKLPWQIFLIQVYIGKETLNEQERLKGGNFYVDFNFDRFFFRFM